MKPDEVIVLSKRQKRLGIPLVCLIFIFVLSVCFIKYRKTDVYSFDLKDCELKSAVLEDGGIRSAGASDDFYFATRPFFLPEGGYTLLITYSSTTDSRVLVQGNNDCVFDITLPATAGETETVTDGRLILPHGTDKGKLKFFNESQGDVCVNEVRMISGRHIFRDYLLFALIAAVLCLTAVIIIFNFNRFNLTWRELSYLGLMAIVVTAVSIPFLIRGDYYETDTQGHMKRIEAIAQGLKDGQLPVLIGPNYANQYGELVALQPGLFLYIPAILRVLNISVPTAYNFFMVLINIMTAVTVFISAFRLSDSRKCGAVAAVFYLIEPFRLFVMLKLGAGAGMGLALVFLPLLAAGILTTLNREGKGWGLVATGLWGLACSHVLGFVLAVIIMFACILLHIRKLFAKGVFVSLIKAAVLFVCLSAGTLLPFAGYYFSDWNRGALAWTDFYHFDVEWDREALNVIALLILIFCCALIRRRKDISKTARLMVAGGFIFTLFALPVFPWFLFENISIVDSFLSMMQYPLRFHFAAVPYVAFAAAFCLCPYEDDAPARRAAAYHITGILAIGVIISAYFYYSRPMLFDDPVSGEINTVMEDYLPGGTLTEWYDTDTGEFSDYDLVEAFSYSKRYTHIDCTYTAHAEGQYMEFPLFYYKGYKAHDGTGAPLLVQKGEHNRVRVYLTASDKEEELHVGFEVDRVYTVVFVFSLIACAVWFAYKFFCIFKSKCVIL
ncbi:MAG: hypothetical protein K6F34_01290 [Lachnospiraceae bacterium]|nr:hypothetical protein [Lachnospiraceae bacterium]